MGVKEYAKQLEEKAAATSKKSGVREYAKQLEEKAATSSAKSGVREYARQLEKEQNAANRQIFKNAYGRYMEESAGTAPAAMRTYIPQPLQKNVLPVSQVGVAQTYLQGKDEKGVDVSLHEQTAVSESTQENDAYVPGSPKLPQEEIERRHRETFREGNPLYNDDRKDNAYASSRPEKDIEFELASAEKRAQEAHVRLSIYAAQQAERGTADLSSPVYQRLLEEKQSALARVDALKAEKKDARNARITQGYKDAQAQVEADQKKYFSKESAELDKIIAQSEEQRDQHIAQSERWEAANGEKLASMKAEYEELRKKGYDVPSRLSTAQIPEYNRFLELKKEIAALEKERADLKKLTDQSTSGMYYASGAKTFSALSEDERQTVLDYIAMLQSGLFSSGATDYTYTSFDGTQKEADYKQTSDTASAYESLQQRLKTRGISPEEIARMQKTMQALYNERARTAANAQRAKSAAEHPVLSSIGSVFTGLIGGISSGADLLLQNASNALGKGWNAAPIDFNTPATAAGAYTDTVRDTVSQKISDGNGAAGQIGAFIYQTGMSGADSALASFLGNAGGAAVLGLGAAYSAAKDAHERGATDAQAMWTGLFAGVFETLFERVSIGNLNALKETPVATVKDIFLNIAKSAGVNASEEAATEAANLISDYLLNGDLSVYSENYYARIAAKESEADARKNALLDMLAQIGLAGVGGALMGVGFAGGAGAYNYTAGRRRNHAAGSLFFNENGKLNDADYSALLTEGLQSGNAEIRDYAARLGEKRDGISQNEAGLLYRMLASENPESNISVDENGRIHIADTAEETARQGEVADASDSEETEEDIAFRDAIVKMDEYGNLVAKTAEDFARDREKKRSASARAVEQEIEGAEQAISPDGAGGKLYAMLSGDVTNDTATEIINNAELASVFETATGAKLEGTLAEKRRIVKEYAEEYVNTRRANTIDQMLKRVTNAAATSFNQNNFKMALGAEGQAAFDQYRETGTAIFGERVGEDNGKVAFDAEFSMFYKMGIAGDEFAYFSDEGNSLTETQAFDVYNAGRRDARHLTASDSTEKSGIRAGASDTDIKTAQRIAKLLKRDIVFLDVENEDFNGCFKDGKIYINVNSGQSIVQIASHEFTHSLESKSAYEKLRRFVFDFYRRQGISKDALLSDKRASHEVYAELSDAELEFEVVAQFVEEKLITDESIMQRIVNTEGKAYGKTLHETFDAIIKKIKAALSGKEEKQLQSLERGRRILAEVVRSADANENVNGVKFNLGNTLGAQLDDWIAGLGKPYGAYNGKYFELGTTPDILVKHGAPRAPVIMYDDCIVKITGGKHDISLDEIAKLPAQLNDPILLFKGSVPNSFVALTEMRTKTGHDVVAAVHINKHFGRTVINKISSLHSRTTDNGANVIVNYVNRQINDGNLLDASSKKAPIWFTSRGLQLPKLVQTIIDANNRVAQKSSDVNRYSMQISENDVPVKYSVNPNFETVYDNWSKKYGRRNDMQLLVGTTSEALQSIGVKEQNIYWDTTKINDSLKKHSELNDPVMKQVPDILENPVIILESHSLDARIDHPNSNRIVMLGEVYGTDGVPIMAVLELEPRNRKGMLLQQIKLVSTYSKTSEDTSDPSKIMQKTQNLIDESTILYIDPQKNRTNAWLRRNRLQLPFGVTKYGSINKVSYLSDFVNSNSMYSTEKDSNKNQFSAAHDERRDIFKGMSKNARENVKAAEDRLIEAAQYLGLMSDEEKPSVSLKTKLRNISLQLLSSPTDSTKLRGQTLDLISGTERGKIDETASDGFNEAFDKYIAAVTLFREDFRAARREAQAAKEKAEADNALLRDMPDFGTADYELSESSRKLTEALVFGEAEERDERSRARNAEMLEAAESARNDSSEPLVRQYDRRAEVVDDRSGYSDVTPEAAEEERKLSESLVMEEQERTYRERREANRAKNREALDALTRTAEESRKERDAAAGAVVDIEKLSERAKNYLDRAENTALRRIGGLLSVPSMAQKQILKTVVHNITSEYMNGGKLSAKAVNDLFEKAYNAGVMIDEDFYSRYENVRNFLRENKITVTEAEKSRIEDYAKFRKSVSGKMRLVKEGGISVKEAFEALQEMAPELFDAATQEKDMLRSIGNVASGLRRIKYTLDGYYGDMAEDFKADAKEKFDVIVKDTVEELNNVKRYVTGEEKKQAEREAAAKTEKTTAGLKEAYAQVKTARRAADRAEARNLLTDYDKSLVDDLLKGRKTLDDVAREKDCNHKGIREVYEAKLEYEKAAKVIREYKKWRKERLRMQADTYLKNANEWKDKQIGLLYSRESMIRNIRDIVNDESTANDLIETYFRADRTNQKINNAKNHYRGMIDKLKLSQKVMHGNAVSESAAVQLLGEAEDNIRILESNPKLDEREGKTLEEWRAVVNGLWKENPGLDAVKIKSAVATFRTIYDELLEQMNETRIRNGYEPIDYRKGYFPHFTAEEGNGLLGAIGKSLGINTEVTALPTTINGLTHTFKPGIRWFGNALQRTSNETTYDAVQGFDRYIEGAAEVIYRTDDIQRLRALAEQIRYRTSDEGIRQQIDAVENDKTLSDEVKEARKDKIYENGRYSLSQFVVELEEYTNVLANKKSRYDRATESAISRNIYNITKAVESRVAANMVALNPASWLTNFVPLTQGAALLDRGMLIRGMWDALRSYKADDGMVARSAFLTNRRGSDPLVRTWSESASAALSKPMEWIDCFVADSLVRARYAQNLKDGLSEAEAMNEADLWVGQVMADRSKGMMPTVFEQRNPLTKLFTQFQLEVNNQLSFLFKDMPSEARKKGMMALVMSFVKFFVGAWLFDEVYEWLVGRRCALDPIGILNDTIGDATGYKLPNLVDLGVGAVKGELPSFKTKKKNAVDTTTGVFKNVAEELPFVGGILGGGRVPINSALPDAENLLKASLSDGWSAGKRLTTAGKELSKPLYYVAPPFGGGQLKKIYEGIKAVAQGGSYTVDANGNDILQYPVYSENASDIARNSGVALFGKSSLPTAREWVESGFDSFSAKETAAYQGAVAAGVSEREAYSLISSLGKIEKTETRSAAELKRKALLDSKISGEGKSVVYYGMMASDSERKLMDSLDAAGADMGRVTKALIACKDAELKKGVTASNDKRNAIRNSSLKENEKILLYRALISENRDDDIEAFRNAGLSIDDFIRCQNEYAITEASYSTPEMRAASIWSWLDATYTDAQIQVIMERLGYAWIISKR